jgi:hypothetical protein
MNTRPTPETDAENDLQCELAAWELLKEARRERDEAREQANDMREKWLAKGQCCEYLGAELHEAIKQRDRLAVALDELIITEGRGLDQWERDAFAKAKQALAAVKGEEQ